jgi:hypothetical protein
VGEAVKVVNRPQMVQQIMEMVVKLVRQTEAAVAQVWSLLNIQTHI